MDTHPRRAVAAGHAGGCGVCDSGKVEYVAMTNVTINGLEELRKALDGFSDRRFNAAIATAMSRTAVIVRDKMRQQMTSELDRPTAYTLNSLYTVPATADKLQALVRFKDTRAVSSGTPATYYMLPNVEGNPRRQKGFEVNLHAAGLLPTGWLVMPGQGAILDSHGNMSRGQIIQILSQLRITMVAGSTRNMSFEAREQIRAQRKAGGRYFVMPVGSRIQPGIYQREFMGNNITPVAIFVKGATYRKRFKFYEDGDAIARQHLEVQVNRALAEHIEKLKVKR
jgi:hypothetical protein